jgi:hypothetical protein
MSMAVCSAAFSFSLVFKASDMTVNVTTVIKSTEKMTDHCGQKMNRLSWRRELHR